MIGDTPSAAVSMTYIAQGEGAVSADPSAIFTALLGSCVSVCFYDPIAHVGGMNHVLLPDSAAVSGEAGFAINSMEM